MNFMKIQGMILGFKIPKIYWKFTSDNVLTLDWIEAVSIREVEKIKLKV